MKKVLLFVISVIIAGVILYKAFPNKFSVLKNKLYTQVKCVLVAQKINSLASTSTSNTQDLLVYIPAGSNVKDILDILTTKKLLEKNEYDPFFCYLRKQGSIPKLQAGYFIIKPHTMLTDLANQLTKPEQAEVSITLPEGLRKDQVVKLLANRLSYNNKFSKFNKQEFENLINKPPKELLKKYPFIPQNAPLEGFLFPDTYSFNKFTATASQVLETLLNNFKQKALPELNSKLNADYSLTPYEKLILASIIERETNNDYTERRMVADILLKRLKINMPLQVDATLLYPKRDWTYVLTYQDIHSDNPYNTYTRTGLPPTPICNPGLSAIKAVNNPISNNYWFYMHDKLGNIHYSTTYNEHIIKVNKYIRNPSNN